MFARLVVSVPRISMWWHGQPAKIAFIENLISNLVVGASLYLTVVYAVVGLHSKWRRIRAWRRARSSLQSTQSEIGGGEVIDVSPQARQLRGTSRWWPVLQLFGMLLVLPGLFPGLWPESLAFGVWGLAFLGAGYALPRMLQTQGRRYMQTRSVVPRLFRGRRPFQVSLLFSLALILTLVGISSLALVSQYSSDVNYETSLGVQYSTYSDNLNIAIVMTFLCFGAALPIYRRARRLLAMNARELMKNDDRPPVLYLRAFMTDELRLPRSASYRKSLIELLAPVRRSLEECVAEGLSQQGPVVALNPPGVSIGPLGAARETIQATEWQSVVATLMDQAGVLVVSVPPGRLSDGLAWELRQIDRYRLWLKVMFVFPAGFDGAGRLGWQELAALLAGTAVGDAAIPVDPGQALIALFSPQVQWIVFTAKKRTEATYQSALAAAASTLACR